MLSTCRPLKATSPDYTCRHSQDLSCMQVAKQQGEYLAGLLGKGQVRQGRDIPPEAKPFKYAHKGSLAYVGSDKAVMDVPSVGPIFGWGAGARPCCCAPQLGAV